MCAESSTATKLVVRTAHTGLVLGIAGSLLLKDTALREALVVPHVAYVASYLTLLYASLFLYFLACVVDPGYLPVKEGDDSDPSSEDEEQETGEAVSLKHRKCGHCGIKQPFRARHCEDCARCVRKFDHHCPWLHTCVGERNHKFFWLFISTTMIIIGWSLQISWSAIDSTGSKGLSWFQYNIFFVLNIIILAVAGAAVTGLWLFHSYLMLTNTTTWEFASRHRITYLKPLKEGINPFHEGYCANTFKFLCNCTTRTWENIYQRTVNKSTKVPMDRIA